MPISENLSVPLERIKQQAQEIVVQSHDMLAGIEQAAANDNELGRNLFIATLQARHMVTMLLTLSNRIGDAAKIKLTNRQDS
jgi:hypothetical protein